MKIGLIIPGNEGFLPFISIFKKILKEKNVEFECVIWNRMNMTEKGIVYNAYSNRAQNNFLKLFNYYKFAGFAAKQALKHKFDKLVVFSPQLALFMYPFLKKHYANRFWLDYRDLSIEQKCIKLFKKLLDISEYISISSPGFKKALPDGYEYILSHNFDIDEIKSILNTPFTSGVRKETMDTVTVSTIGAIRLDSNIEVIDSIKGNNKILLRFIGEGMASKTLQEYAERTNAKNVTFSGFYKKCDEHIFYETTDFVNIYYPHILSHDTALSNRFYKSLVFRKPMIVRSNSIQGDYVKKYRLGLSLDDCNDLSAKLCEYVIDDDFSERCNMLLSEFCKDYDCFYNKFVDFIDK